MKNQNLLQGDIKSSIIKMAMPLMGMSFIHMAYNMVDLMWIGRLSTDAVAAVGTVGFFMWAVNAVSLIIKTGMAVELSQARGREDYESLEKISIGGMQLNIFLGVFLTVIYLTFNKDIYTYFNLEKSVYNLCLEYHNIVSVSIIFFFLMTYFSAHFFARGDSSTPFKTSLIAMAFNIVLDPILIFGLGPIPSMGVRGAALATAFAQFSGALIYIIIGLKYEEDYMHYNYFKRLETKNAAEVLRLGAPACGQSLIHCLVSIKLNQYIAIYGALGIATYTIGSQIEAVSYMSAEGFSTAFTSFFGQNYGGQNFERLQKGKKICINLILKVGIIATILLCFGGRTLYKLFIPNDPDVINEGAIYLVILGSTTILMSQEIGVTGMMNGLGLTRYPAFVSALLNIIRIPLAAFLMKYFKLKGIWLSMSISQALKGLALLIIFAYLENQTDGFKIDMERYRKRLKAR